MGFFVYILLCADGSLYTGWTTELDRRVEEHNTSTKGAKYTHSRRPVTLAYSESFETESEARRREYAIKQLSRQEKIILISKKN